MGHFLSTCSLEKKSMMLLVSEILELLLSCGFSHINHLLFYSLDSCHDWIIVAPWRIKVCVLKKKMCCRNNLQKNLKKRTWSKSVSVCYLKGLTQIKDVPSVRVLASD